MRPWSLALFAVLGGCNALLGIDSFAPDAARDDAALADAAPDVRDAPFTSIQIFVGADQTCVVVDERLRCWGRNNDGQLGFGHTNTIGDDELPSTVTDVPVGAPVRSVALGRRHTCALLASGAVRCWGHGGDGALGAGNLTNRPSAAGAVDVMLGAKIEQLVAGDVHTCALTDTGAVICWGSGQSGRLGYGDEDSVGGDEPPVNAGTVELPGIAVELAAGEAHTCARMSTGAVACWGRGANGAVGHASMADALVPASISIGVEVVQLAAGGQHTCARAADGSVRCWGRAGQGELGYGNLQNIGDTETPASAGSVSVGFTASHIATGDEHTCAVAPTGEVNCWGRNSSGGLGRGTITPVGDVGLPSAAGPSSVPRATAIGAGRLHTCLVDDVRQVWCWGDNNTGQLGYAIGQNIGDNELPTTAGPVSFW